MVEGIEQKQGRNEQCQGLGELFKLVDAVFCLPELISECCNAGRHHQDEQGEREVKGVVLKYGRSNHGIDIAEGEDHQEAQCEQEGGLLKDAFERGWFW